MRLDAGYDMHTGKLESINSDLSMTVLGIAFSAGQRYNREDDIQTYVAGIGIHPFQPLYLNGSVWYDAFERETRDIAATIKYVSQCWGVQIGAVKRPGDFNLTVLFELKGITRALKM
jgi:hypothetical protein